jgi:dTDP-4-amino-4,6-dideoxygalactose transaminase
VACQSHIEDDHAHRRGVLTPLFTPAVNLRVDGTQPADAARAVRLGACVTPPTPSEPVSVAGLPVGAQADITGFSFHAVKNLTTAEGGALAFHLPEPFDHAELYAYFNTMSLHGQSKDALAKTQPGAWRYDVTFPGWKCNMTDLQAAIGLVELDRYDSETLPRRKAICERYSAAFQRDDRFVTPTFEEAATGHKSRTSSYHLYMLRITKATEEQRDSIITAIAKREVSVNVHFIPLPMLSFYKEAGHRIVDYPKHLRPVFPRDQPAGVFRPDRCPGG